MRVMWHWVGADASEVLSSGVREIRVGVNGRRRRGAGILLILRACRCSARPCPSAMSWPDERSVLVLADSAARGAYLGLWMDVGVWLSAFQLELEDTNVVFALCVVRRYPVGHSIQV